MNRNGEKEGKVRGEFAKFAERRGCVQAQWTSGIVLGPRRKLKDSVARMRHRMESAWGKRHQLGCGTDTQNAQEPGEDGNDHPFVSKPATHEDHRQNQSAQNKRSCLRRGVNGSERER